MLKKAALLAVCTLVTITVVSGIVNTNVTYGQEDNMDNNEKVSLFVNEHLIYFPDQKPFIDENDRTQVPLRFVSRALDAEVNWNGDNGDNGEVEIVKDNLKLQFNINDSSFVHNGEVLELDAKAKITEKDRTVIPLRALKDAFNLEINWSNDYKYVQIVNEEITVSEEYIKDNNLDVDENEKINEKNKEDQNESQNKSKEDRISDKVNAVYEVVSEYNTLNMDEVEKLVTKTKEYGIDIHVVLGLIQVESNFDPENVGSVAGARGLLQVMPSTAERVANSHGYEFNSELLFDAKYNIKIGTTYLKERYEKYDGDLHRVLSAYNMGSENLESYIQTHGTAESDFSNTVLKQADIYKERIEENISE
ncbi:stalk domain-containing protein [Natranaerofaba carboxydovora]|uniref:stalk domain-containing protein n=1 Tax=Natranaerofaba carboxydovora TaxID=2742683 RepID=UPI001F1354F3|nr:stalk domain-containing protein [Natranaerofaba carboxydovora]UMZ73639.1 Membrane-bound lytic murein transglycosylase C [Natranaerofaba carboxydovora]